MPKEILDMSEEQFKAFFEWLPLRVQILIKGGCVDAGKVLEEWLQPYKEKNMGSERTN